jgi:hypothetical protein
MRAVHYLSPGGQPLTITLGATCSDYMDNKFLKQLFESAQKSLKDKAVRLGNAEGSNAVLSYQRVIQHLSDFVPQLHSQLVQHSALAGGSELGDNAWWRVQFPGIDFSIELEHRYFEPGTDRSSLTGKRRADVILGIRQGSRNVRVLIEYKTSLASTEANRNVLEQAFEEQLIPYLNHEVAQLIGDADEATDQFFCCVAVSFFVASPSRCAITRAYRLRRAKAST